MVSSVSISGIVKKYNDITALNHISLSVEKGEIFGFIGPDGAGKTTLFRILTTLLIPDEGEAFVEGFHTVKDYKKIREIVGYMPGRFSLYQDLSVEENLKFFASIFKTKISENYHLIKDILRFYLFYQIRRMPDNILHNIEMNEFSLVFRVSTTGNKLTGPVKELP